MGFVIIYKLLNTLLQEANEYDGWGIAMMSAAADQRQQPAADLPNSKTVQEAAFPSPRLFRWIAAFLLAYFGARLLFFALEISPAIPPDETTHFGICRIFSKVFLLPGNSPETYQYGLVTNIPWLYYWIMGKLLLFNFFGISNLVFLRLLNIPLAFGTIYYTWRLLRLLTDDRLTQLLLIVAMTNTMMFSFLSASVSYDNLTNLLAAMSVYYLFAFFRERTGVMLLISCLCQLAGCLTKITILPLILILNIVLLVHEFRNLPQLPAALGAFLRTSDWRGRVFMVMFLIALALNIQLYGDNYIHYKAIEPAMTAVLPVESALQNRLAARGYIVGLFQEGRVSKEKALEMVSRISNPGDRESGIYMIEMYDQLKNSGFKSMSLADYIPIWLEWMAAGIFGIVAHVNLATFWPIIAPIAFLALLTVLAFLVRWRPWDAAWFSSYLVLIAGFYGYFLMYEVNYLSYHDSGAVYAALQGRYIFPVIGLIYVLSSFYLLRLFKNRWARLGLFALATFVFVMSDFPLFLSKLSPEWYAWPQG
jgi:hypothetical protein